jgi:quercetin dioxygenase-like cupin family protein
LPAAIIEWLRRFDPPGEQDMNTARDSEPRAPFGAVIGGPLSRSASRRRSAWLPTLAAVAGAALLPYASTAQDEQGFVRLTPEQVVWERRDPGPDIAVIAGDPEQEGFYVLRARFAPGVFSAPHYHPSDRHVTVLSGTWYTGTGPEFDVTKAVPLGPGSYMLHPAGAVHWDGAVDDEVIVEIKGIGPAPRIPFEG